MNNEFSLVGGHAPARTVIAVLAAAVILIAGCAREQPEAPGPQAPTVTLRG